MYWLDKIVAMKLILTLSIVVGMDSALVAPSEESCSRVEKVGCFRDSYQTNGDRVFPNKLIDSRDSSSPKWNGHSIDWSVFDESTRRLVCMCAKAAKGKGWTYFGIQFFGECWSGPSLNPARDGPSDKCMASDFKSCVGSDETLCVGKVFANYVYKLKPDPINSSWAKWSSWSACTKMCNNGKRSRTRTCTNPQPLNGGRECPGKATEKEGCNQEPCKLKCDSKVDIGILLESSMARSNWGGTLAFLKRLPKSFRIGPHQVKFGVIRFSFYPAMMFGFSNRQTTKGFLNKVSQIHYTHGRGRKDRTDLALQMAEKQLMCPTCGTRKTAEKALLIVTDGTQSQKSVTLDKVTARLKRQGVAIVVVSVGDADHTILKKIATNANHVVTLDRHIDDSINKLAKLLCKRGLKTASSGGSRYWMVKSVS